MKVCGNLIEVEPFFRSYEEIIKLTIAEINRLADEADKYYKSSAYHEYKKPNIIKRLFLD
jgi:hypothetical protein